MIRFIARTLLGGLFVVGGYHTAVAPNKVAKLVEDAGVTKPEELVRFNGVAQVIGGSALTLGIFPRAAAAGLVASMAATTAVGHPFWKETDPQQRSASFTQVLKNTAVIGGLLMVIIDSKPKFCRKAAKR